MGSFLSFSTNYPVPVKRILAIFCLLTPAARAQAPTVVSRQPAANAVAAPRTGPVTVGFSAPVPAGTNLMVVGTRSAGRRLGTSTATGNSLSLNPAPAFAPGELVRVSIPRTGAGALPMVYEFTAAAGPASATFGPRQSFAVGVYPQALAPLDMDGDGDIDLAVANKGTGGTSGTGRILIYRNSGAGQFVVTNAPGFSARLPTDIEAADVDQDGALDLLYVNANVTNLIQYARNDGAGTFTQTPAYARGGTYFTTADFNGDGHPDYAAAFPGGQEATIGLYNGIATSVYSFTMLPANYYPGKPAIADFDGDGDLDVMMGTEISSAPWLLRLRNDGAGQFTPLADLPMADAGNIWTGDLNHDGRPDVVSLSSAGVMLTLLGQGNFTFAPPVPSAVPLTSKGYLVLADLNGDGHLDAAVPSGNASVLQIMLGDGTGRFTVGAQLATTAATYAAPYAADFNGDGRLDLALPINTANVVDIFLNQAPLATTPARSLANLTVSPNPVSGDACSLRYALPFSAAVNLTLRDAMGRPVQRVVEQQWQGAGPHSVQVPVTGLAAGVYLACLTYNQTREYQRVVVNP